MFIRTEKDDIINCKQYKSFEIKEKPLASGTVHKTFAVIAVSDDDCREILSTLDENSAKKICKEIFLHMQNNVETLDVNIFIGENGKIKI